MYKAKSPNMSFSFNSDFSSPGNHTFITCRSCDVSISTLFPPEFNNIGTVKIRIQNHVQTEVLESVGSNNNGTQSNMAQVNIAAITYKSSGKIPAVVVFQPQKMQCYATFEV
jgi:hypothetical protein